MSMRRFVAYFFAVSAGSTVAFASMLMGPPALPEMSASDVSPAFTLSLPAPAALPPSHRRPAKISQAALVQVALVK